MHAQNSSRKCSSKMHRIVCQSFCSQIYDNVQCANCTSLLNCRNIALLEAMLIIVEKLLFKLCSVPNDILHKMSCMYISHPSVLMKQHTSGKSIVGLYNVLLPLEFKHIYEISASLRNELSTANQSVYENYTNLKPFLSANQSYYTLLHLCII